MTRAAMLACLPWFTVLLASVAAICLVVRADQARFQWRRLLRLHADQGGSAQTLSFVLTLPFFIMLLMLIVQVSQLMIGTVVVHYAAYAAARSAVVWIPACLSNDEPENCIASFAPDPQATDQEFPVTVEGAPGYGPSEGGVTYLIDQSGEKYNKIRMAAVLALMPISPSRDVGEPPAGPGANASSALKSVYAAMVPSSGSNTMIPVRLDNKLGYALNHTTVEVRFYHSNQEPPLGVCYLRARDVAQFQSNEIGWQDPITVTVKYDLPLLPGPGRLLAQTVANPNGSPDQVAATIQKQGQVYTWPLSAQAILGNEGEKSVVRYAYQAD